MVDWLRALLQRILARLLSRGRQLWWALLHRLIQWYSNRRATRRGQDARSGQGHDAAAMRSTGYVCASQVPGSAEDYLSAETANVPGPSVSSKEAAEDRPASSAGSVPYESATFQNLPDDAASTTTIHRPRRISLAHHAPAENHHPDFRRRLRHQASRASVRQSSVSVTVVGPAGEDTNRPPSMNRSHSRLSQYSGRSGKSKASSMRHHTSSPVSTTFSETSTNSARPISIITNNIPRSPPGPGSPTTPAVTDPVIPETYIYQDNDFDIRATPMLPSEVMDKRYGNVNRIQRNLDCVIVIPQMYNDYIPQGYGNWQRHLHPEGSVYFYHCCLRIFTISDLSDPDILERADDFATLMATTLKGRFHADVPDAMECVISVQMDENESWIDQYYCVDNIKRVIFWLRDFEIAIGNPRTPFEELHGCRELWHLKDEMETQYWVHWEAFPFPHATPLPKTVIDELLAILVCSGHDALIATSTCAPYSVDDTQKMITLVNELKGIWDLDNNSHAVYVAARTMETYTHERAINYSGMDIARLQRNQFVYVGTKHEATPLVRIMSPFLFFAPAVHLKMLESLWIDEVINHVPWTKFINKCRDDWRDLIVMATVLLTVNTALLAIPTVDNGFTTTRTGVQILSYVSTICSVGTILTGLLLIRQYTTQESSTAADAMYHISRHDRPGVGLEIMAILHALPYACLMWAMATFLGAFCALVFERTDAAPRASFAVALSVVLLLTYWCIYDAWEEDKWYALALDGRYLARAVRRVLCRDREKDSVLATPEGSVHAQPRSIDVAAPAGESIGPRNIWWRKVKAQWTRKPRPSSPSLPIAMTVLHARPNPAPTNGHANAA